MKYPLGYQGVSFECEESIEFNPVQTTLLGFLK